MTVGADCDRVRTRFRKRDIEAARVTIVYDSFRAAVEDYAVFRRAQNGFPNDFAVLIRYVVGQRVIVYRDCVRIQRIVLRRRANRFYGNRAVFTRAVNGFGECKFVRRYGIVRTVDIDYIARRLRVCVPNDLRADKAYVLRCSQRYFRERLGLRVR